MRRLQAVPACDACNRMRRLQAVPACLQAHAAPASACGAIVVYGAGPGLLGNHTHASIPMCMRSR